VCKLIMLNDKLLRTHHIELVLLICIMLTIPIGLPLLDKYQILLFMHKYVHNRVRFFPSLSGYFNENKEIHPHDRPTRHEEDLKETKSLPNFKNKLKCHLLQSLE